MVKEHSDSERGNLLPAHGLLLLNSSKDSFICIIPSANDVVSWFHLVQDEWEGHHSYRNKAITCDIHFHNTFLIIQSPFVNPHSRNYSLLYKLII